MQVKVFKFDRNGKVSFTQEELEKLLNEVYTGGYNDGKRAGNYWTWTSPYWYYGQATNTITSEPSKPYITWTTSTSSNTDVTEARFETSNFSDADTYINSPYAVAK